MTFSELISWHHTQNWFFWTWMKFLSVYFSLSWNQTPDLDYEGLKAALYKQKPGVLLLFCSTEKKNPTVTVCKLYLLYILFLNIIYHFELREIWSELGHSLFLLGEILGIEIICIFLKIFFRSIIVKFYWRFYCI